MTQIKIMIRLTFLKPENVAKARHPLRSERHPKNLEPVFLFLQIYQSKSAPQITCLTFPTFPSSTKAFVHPTPRYSPTLTLLKNQEIEQPQQIESTLYPYQKRAVSWMLQREIQLENIIKGTNDDLCRGGILAEEMGLGKT
jgi:SNF2 family DNA or RNA helicase